MLKKFIDSQLPDKLAELNLRVEVYDAADLPNEYIDQLIKKSWEPHVLKYEGHEDAEGRFKDHESYKKWTSDKKRIIYLLLVGEEVGGIIWFGERKNPNIADKYSITFAIRLYEGCVGKGLSKSFMKVSHDDIGVHYPGQKIWLDFVSENIAAGKAYESFGYHHLGEADDRTIMGF